MGLFSLFKKKPAVVADIVGEPIVNTTEIQIVGTFSFKTRDEYLDYKADWKARYEQAGKNVRASAKAKRLAEQAFSAGPDTYYNMSRVNLYYALQAARSDHNHSKRMAALLLEERAKSKVEAGRQRELRLKKAL